MSITIGLPSGERVVVDAETILLGRDAACHVSLPAETTLQSQHAKIRRIANRWLIESLGDWLVQVGDASPGHKDWLKPGDTIRLSERGPTLVFEPTETGVVSGPPLAHAAGSVKPQAVPVETADTDEPPPLRDEVPPLPDGVPPLPDEVPPLPDEVPPLPDEVPPLADDLPPPLPDELPPFSPVRSSFAPTLGRKAKSLASSLASRGKAAAQLVAKQAERTKIDNISLPSAYQALGKNIYSSGSSRSEFAELYRQIDSILNEINAIKTRSANEPKAEGMASKVKAAATATATAAQVKGLQMKCNHLLSELGKVLFNKCGVQSGPAALTHPIDEWLLRLQTLDAEIKGISQASSGQILTPKRIAVCAAALAIGLLVLVAHYMIPGGRSRDGSQATFTQGHPDARKGEQATTGVRSPQPADNMASLKMPERSLLPIERQAKLHDEGIAMFSPKGHFVILIDGLTGFKGKTEFVPDEGNPPKCSLWTIPAGEALKPPSDNSKGFSYPVAFSSDEKFLASVDGERLQIWRLEPKSVLLASTVSLERGVKWLRISWKSGRIVLTGVSKIAETGSQKTVQNIAVVEPGASDDFAVAYSTAKVLNEVNDKEMRVTSAPPMLVSPDGTFAVTPVFASAQKVSAGKVSAIQVSELATKKNVATLAVDDGIYTGFEQARVSVGRSDGYTLQWSYVDFSLDGRALMLKLKTESGCRLLVWDTASWKQSMQLDGRAVATKETGPSTDLEVRAISPDGRWAAVWSLPVVRTSKGVKTLQTILLWSMEKRGLVLQISAPEDGTVFFTPNSQGLVNTGTNPSDKQDDSVNVEVWDIATREPTTQLAIIPIPEGRSSDSRIVRAEASPDGKFLVTGTVIGQVRLWDITRLSHLQRMFVEAGEAWKAGKMKEAIGQYDALVRDDMAWFLKRQYPLIFSRLIDGWASLADASKTRESLDRARANRIKSINLETEAGRRALAEYLAELKAQQEQESAEQRSQAPARGEEAYQRGYQDGVTQGTQIAQSMRPRPPQARQEQAEEIIRQRETAYEQAAGAYGEDNVNVQRLKGLRDGYRQAFSKEGIVTP